LHVVRGGGGSSEEDISGKVRIKELDFWGGRERMGGSILGKGVGQRRVKEIGQPYTSAVSLQTKASLIHPKTFCDGKSGSPVADGWSVAIH